MLYLVYAYWMIMISALAWVAQGALKNFLSTSVSDIPAGFGVVVVAAWISGVFFANRNARRATKSESWRFGFVATFIALAISGGSSSAAFIRGEGDFCADFGKICEVDISPLLGVAIGVATLGLVMLYTVIPSVLFFWLGARRTDRVRALKFETADIRANLKDATEVDTVPEVFFAILYSLSVVALLLLIRRLQDSTLELPLFGCAAVVSSLPAALLTGWRFASANHRRPSRGEANQVAAVGQAAMTVVWLGPIIFPVLTKNLLPADYVNEIALIPFVGGTIAIVLVGWLVCGLFFTVGADMALRAKR